MMRKRYGFLPPDAAFAIQAMDDVDTIVLQPAGCFGFYQYGVLRFLREHLNGDCTVHAASSGVLASAALWYRKEEAEPSLPPFTVRAAKLPAWNLPRLRRTALQDTETKLVIDRP
jgi:hypothetical protein